MRFDKFYSILKRKKKLCESTIPNIPSIDIQEFVKGSIVGIMTGIQGAQKEYSKGNSAFDPLICPAYGPPTSDHAGSTIGFADKVYELEFDLAITITASSSSKAEGKAGIQVIGVYRGDIGGSAESAGTHSTISRIRFKVPVRYSLAKLNKPDWNP